MKRLPIGCTTLIEIINEDYIYIDKTMFIDKMVKRNKYYFLSRPRRFGKSLIVDTLKQAFLGNKAIFKGLYLEHNWNWDVTYPVIHFSFGGSSAYESKTRLINIIKQTLQRHAKEYEVELEFEDDYGVCFDALIKSLYAKYQQQVIILIDEYDKPILDVIDKKNEAIINREILKGLYGHIKDNDQYLKFVFITGVSKFSKTGLFSGLNSLNDISLDSRYADICGYTQANIENELSEYMEAGKVDLVKLRQWYNGYNFLGTEEQRVYNPFDVLLFCDKNYTYDCYWFKTGTPTFLIKLFEKNNYFIPEVLEDPVIDATILDSFDVDNVPIETLLFQSGYLTIKNATTIGINHAYVLTYPNLEVRSSLNTHLAQIGIPDSKNRSLLQLSNVLKQNQLDELGNIFGSHFAGIPYNWYKSINNYEGFYASVVYSLLCGLGYDCIPEDISNIGRMDLTMKMPDKVIIIEFKLSSRGDATQALQQIKDRRYADKYKGLGLPIYIAGISFDATKRSLDSYLWEQI